MFSLKNIKQKGPGPATLLSLNMYTTSETTNLKSLRACDCRSAAVVKLSPPLKGGSALMSRTVLCGQTFAV